MVNVSKTDDMLPYKLLEEPLFYPSNIKLFHPKERPRGYIILKRQTFKPEGVLEFCRTAKASSLSALKTLSTKPEVAKELTFKLAEDIRKAPLNQFVYVLCLIGFKKLQILQSMT